MDLLRRVGYKLFVGQTPLRNWLVASLVANILIVVTGAVVRLTSSGLGCPTWPRCTPDAFVPRAELGIHGVIEFGNRLLAFVLIVLAVGAFAAAWRNRGIGSRVWGLCLAVGLGIPMQVVIGGITVWSDLNPWVVALHLLLSIALIVLSSFAVLHASRTRPSVATRAQAWLARLTFACAMLAIWVGTIVTGAGPHAGDADVPRNGLLISEVTRYHSLAAWLTLAGALASLAMLRRSGERAGARAALALVAVLLTQGTIGYVQYFLGLPVWLVSLHLLGAGVTAAAASWLLFAAGKLRQEGVQRHGQVHDGQVTVGPVE